MKRMVIVKKIVKSFLVVMFLGGVGIIVLSVGLHLRGGGFLTQDVPDQLSKDKPRITAQENDLDLLARAVFAEAKGEPYEGQIAVAAVILNRVDHPEFPNTIAGVIYEPLAFQVVANGSINQQPNQEAITAAFDAVHGVDPSNGSLYFYNPNKTRNQWIRSRPVTTTIGRHTFSS